MAFLLAELGLIDEEFRRLRSEGATRTSGYLTIVATVATAGAAYTAQLKLAWWSIAIPAGIVLFLLGLHVVYGMVVRDIASDRCARASGRVRRYFIDLDAGLAHYVSFQSNDAPMPWVTSNRSVQRQMIVAVSAACGAAAGAGILARQGAPGWLTFLAFAVAGSLLGLGIRCMVGRKLQKAARLAASEQRFH